MVSNKVLTLVLIHEPTRLLLGMKKRGFGQGRWNGFGGKVEKGETIKEGAIRELHEESGLRADKLDEVGRIIFEFVGEPQLLEVHVFKGIKYSGVPVETEEMRPQWYNIEDIPYKMMWPDDILWIPMFLKGVTFSGYFKFKGHDEILEYNLKQVDELPA